MMTNPNTRALELVYTAVEDHQNVTGKPIPYAQLVRDPLLLYELGEQNLYKAVLDLTRAKSIRFIFGETADICHIGLRKVIEKPIAPGVTLEVEA